jgi:hypothetical protein
VSRTTLSAAQVQRLQAAGYEGGACLVDLLAFLVSKGESFRLESIGDGAYRLWTGRHPQREEWYGREMGADPLRLFYEMTVDMLHA